MPLGNEVLEEEGIRKAEAVGVEWTKGARRMEEEG